MAEIDPHQFLWDNICAALKTPKNVSIDRVKAKVEVGRGTVQRIRDREGSPQLSSVVAIADALGVPTWRLLHPDLGDGAVVALNNVDHIHPIVPLAELLRQIGTHVALLSPLARRMAAANLSEWVAQGCGSESLPLVHQALSVAGRVDVSEQVREAMVRSTDSRDLPEISD